MVALAKQPRHLTATEKAKNLEGWFRVLTDLPWQSSDAPGDRGEPDADMVPWCIRLNRLPGVCTLQSCAGHRDGGVISPGHLWLRLDRVTDRAFDRGAAELAGVSGVDQVSRLYRPDGQTVIVVAFHGNERGALAVSMNAICSFFERIVER